MFGFWKKKKESPINLNEVFASEIISLRGSPVLADFMRGLEVAGEGNYAAALKEWRPLAEQGNASVQFLLGLFYYQGEGVAQDFEKSVFWYRRAAEQGNANAQYFLGCCYTLGQGVTEDRIRGYMWFIISDSHGSEMGKKARRIAESWRYDGLTSSEKSKARRLARECATKGYKDN